MGVIDPQGAESQLLSQEALGGPKRTPSSSLLQCPLPLYSSSSSGPLAPLDLTRDVIQRLFHGPHSDQILLLCLAAVSPPGTEGSRVRG